MDSRNFEKNIDNKNINVRDIIRFQEERQREKMHIFDNVLKKVYKRIKNAVHKNDNFCIYIIPEFMLGTPIYNLQHCIKYIMINLQQNGFIVYYYKPNIISITWPVKDIQDTIISYNKDKPCITSYTPSSNIKQISYNQNQSSNNNLLFIEPDRNILPENSTFSQKKVSPFKKIDTANKTNYFLEENSIGKNGGFFSKYRNSGNSGN